MGTVLGNAVYANYLVVQQGATVNTGSSEGTPQLGEYLYLGAGAKIIGDMTIGHDVNIGVDACVYKKDVQDNITVYKDENGSIQYKERDNFGAARGYFL